ncbi:MAG: hypothetical protein ACF8TS_08490 [Maioricimonas sp. JB049]
MVDGPDLENEVVDEPESQAGVQMTVLQASEHERLVKSDERVRDLGEVFTPSATVAAMLDLLPADVWNPHPASTFLEPACGDGNFLVAILDRKLEAAANALASRTLPAGQELSAYEFHALEALSSVYAVDISVENVVGGIPGHELGARDRLLQVFKDWHYEVTSSRLTVTRRIFKSARWIVARNVLVGNMLDTNADGTESGRDSLPLVEYTWHPETGQVAVAVTTFGRVLAAQKAEASGIMPLFADEGPTEVWVGTPYDLHRAPVIAPSTRVPVPRNGRR